MVKDLRDRVLVVTGASSGIGAATARQAASAGMDVVLAARREQKLRQVAREVEHAGRRALVVPTDVADDASVQALADRAVEHFGRVDVMFANAGYGFMQPVHRMGEADHRRLFDVNYFGTVRCIRAAVAVMKRQGEGQIILTSSVVARVGLPYYAAYAATKAAQLALAQGVRLEVEPFGIDVTVVLPIGTSTEFFEVSAEIGGRDEVLENTPDLFVQSPDYVARRTVAAMRRPRREVWPSRLVRLGVWLGSASPALVDFGLRRHARKLRKTLGDQAG